MADSSVSIKLPNSEVLHFVDRNSCYNLHWFFFFTGIASVSWKCWTSIWFLSCKNVISLRSQTFQESFWKVISEDRLCLPAKEIQAPTTASIKNTLNNRWKACLHTCPLSLLLHKTWCLFETISESSIYLQTGFIIHVKHNSQHFQHCNKILFDSNKDIKNTHERLLAMFW